MNPKTLSVLLGGEEDADGALPRGIRVVKIAEDRGDRHELGARGKILASMNEPGLGLAYFVEWDDMPGVRVFVVAKKIAAEQ